MPTALPGDPADLDADLRPELADLLRRARTITPPPSDLPQWRGVAEDGYRRAVVRLRAAIDAATAALAAAEAAA